ncbi:SURF1 family protein [Demequina lutea]|uniref:SURF1-like protein n=1 Tax=Demequina lutea TaxID=431489 RepID=A0A7Y9Z8C0_9MICO|nr:SURF1 family cytochrome oxidase biogenesis protein [Demequina lutea]NYI40692.1 cytochrome oxidase assembly protein ShyY1 [Demequina lutea]
MPPESDVPEAPPVASVRRLRWGALAGATTVAILSVAICGFLGTWQWQRAHQQAHAVDPDPRAALAAVMRPGEAGRGEGRLIEVDGTWANVDVGLVAGKELEGVPAVLLVLPLTVPADATGTGAEGTLGVIAGWLPADEVASTPAVGGSTHVTGYVRGGEGLTPTPNDPPVAGAVWLGSMSTASLAQHWTAPVYSYLVVADSPAPGWRALPPPVEQKRLDLRSLTYSVEWWLFGIFAAVISVRWMRDNGREQTSEEDV